MSAPAPPPHETPRFTIAAIIAGGVVAALQVGKIPISMPYLHTEFGIDLTALGTLMGVFSVFGLIGGVLAGALMSRFGDRRLFLMGLFILSLSTFAGALAPSYAALFGARLIEGLAYLLISVTGSVILRRIAEPRHRSVVLAIWSCFMPFGIAAAMLLFPLVGGWRAFWLINAGLAAGLFTLNWMLVPRGDRGTNLSWRTTMTQALQVYRLPEPVLLAAMFCAYNIMFYALVSFLPTLLMAQMGIGLQLAGKLSAAASGTNIIGNLAAGLLLRRNVSSIAIIGAAYVSMGLSGLAVFLHPFPAPVTLAMCAVFCGSGGLIPATLFASIPRSIDVPILIPAAFGLLLQGTNLGLVIGPVIIGRIVKTFGWEASAVIVGPAAIIGLCLLYIYRNVGFRRLAMAAEHVPG